MFNLLSSFPGGSLILKHHFEAIDKVCPHPKAGSGQVVINKTLGPDGGSTTLHI
jgi:hypothetical protein